MHRLAKSNFSIKPFSNTHTLDEAVGRWSTKLAFVKIYQYSQENVCGEVSLLINFQAE